VWVCFLFYGSFFGFCEVCFVGVRIGERLINGPQEERIQNRTHRGVLSHEFTICRISSSRKPQGMEQ